MGSPRFAALPGCLLHRHGAGDLEGHFRAVDVVIAAEDQRGLHVDHGIAGQYAGLQRLADSRFHRLDEFAGNDATDDLVFEHEAAARRGGFEVDHHVAVLALATALPNELALDIGDRPPDGLPEGDLGLADIGFD